MLEIWMGRANTGKSRHVLEKIRDLGAGGKQLLLVPDTPPIRRRWISAVFAAPPPPATPRC